MGVKVTDGHMRSVDYNQHVMRECVNPGPNLTFIVPYITRHIDRVTWSVEWVVVVVEED